MGHGDSSETLGGGGALRSAASGIGAPASECAGTQAHSERVSRAARLLLLALRVYQTFFSALMPSACKFYPTCSHYAVDAVRIHGARRGSWLALQRVARCHPFSRGGVDLVPSAAEVLRDKNTGNTRTEIKNPGNEVHS